MDKNTMLKGLYPITPNFYKSDIDYLGKLESVMKSNINIFQFRSKTLSFKRKKYLLKRISMMCIENNVKLIVNDDYNLARNFGADGLHLGSKDINLKSARKYFGDNFIIGRSCYNSIELAKQSVNDGASYVSFGSMFPTRSKESAIIAKHSIIIEAKKIINIPICVIGGINKLNLDDLMKYKPDMVCMISGVFDHNNVSEEIKNIKDIILR